MPLNGPADLTGSNVPSSSLVAELNNEVTSNAQKLLHDYSTVVKNYVAKSALPVLEVIPVPLNVG